MTEPTTHRVVARTTDGRYVTARALTGLTYLEAATAWTRLDDARRAGRLPMVDYLVVRSEDDPDPRWARAEADPAPFLVGRRQGHKARQDARRAFGLAHGYKGQAGGWIYRAADLEREAAGGRRARAIAQGWDMIDSRHQGATINEGGRWYWNDLDLLTVEAQAVAS